MSINEYAEYPCGVTHLLLRTLLIYFVRELVISITAVAAERKLDGGYNFYEKSDT